ncbi:MAG: hypothetical protein LH660_06650, partial [Phormidesmis sp. CAN_BIN36]|nr:hypothetical protein [Phormidesmis sp. CAN_BIN36]
MNFPGRIIGGALVAIAVAWILNIAGVFPFNNRGTNQIDSKATTNPNQNTGSQSLNANNPANRADTQNGQGSGTTTGSGNGDPISSTDTTIPPAPPSDGTANGAGT